MIRNYLKIAFRHFIESPLYSFINIFGLTFGIACSILIMLWVQDELSYDTYSERYEDTYRITGDFLFGGRDMKLCVAPALMGQELMNKFPEVESYMRFNSQGRYIIHYEDKSFIEHDVVYADSTFFEFFSIPLISGDANTALVEPNTLVLSNALAKKIFGDENPIGKSLKLDNNEHYRITGIYSDIPHNSHFNFEMICSLSSIEDASQPNWLSMNYVTYLILDKNTDIDALKEKMNRMMEKLMEPLFKQFMGLTIEEFKEDGRAVYSLQKLTDIHLKSDLSGEVGENSDIRYVYIFALIAFFILLVACINFMNLSTARSSGRAKEVGIRKVAGANKTNLIRQFLAESVLMALLSFILALITIELILPYFNNLTNKLITVPYINPFFIVASFFIIVATGFLAGSYPAFYLARFRPVAVLKGKLRKGTKSGWLRTILVVIQFATSIVLIIGTITVYKQLKFFQHKNLGFDKEQLLVINDTYLLGDNASVFKEEIQKLDEVKMTTLGSYLPIPSWRNNSAVFPDGKTNDSRTTPMQIWRVDFDYFDTYKLEIVDGRSFDKNLSTDSSAVIINEAAKKQFAWDNPIEHSLSFPVSAQGDMEHFDVIGVVENFHFESLRQEIAPMVIVIGSGTTYLTIRFKTSDIEQFIGEIKSKWTALGEDQPFDYTFVDDRLNARYDAEMRLGKILGIFAIIAVFIGGLGLFGLAAFMTEQRTKEIGIRKVMGANIRNIIQLLIADFTKWVGVSFVVASIIAFYAMDKWLNNFAYKTTLSWWVFVAAGAGALVIAWLTVIWQTYKVAVKNPVESLRYE